MINFIFLVLHWTPFFHVSCDDFFGRYQSGCRRRYSLLAIPVGEVKFYFITLHGGALKFFHVLKLSSISPPVLQGEVDQKTADYSVVVKSLKDDEIAIQYEFLKEGFNNNCTSRSSMETKVSSYASTYLVLVAFYAYIFNEVWGLSGVEYFSAMGLFLIGLFPLISCGLVVLSFFRISGVVRAAFSDIKASGHATPASQVALAYTNWYASKGENRALASYVKNIESYMAGALVLVFFLWIYIFIIESVDRAGSTENVVGQELTIIDSRGQVDRAAMSKFIAQLTTADSDKVYIISGPATDKSAYSHVVEFVKLFLTHQDLVEISLGKQEVLGSSVIVKL